MGQLKFSKWTNEPEKEKLLEDEKEPDFGYSSIRKSVKPLHKVRKGKRSCSAAEDGEKVSFATWPLVVSFF